jgi:hypothetical protein
LQRKALLDPPARQTGYEAAIAEVARSETLTKLTSTIKAMGVLRISFLRLSFNHKARAKRQREESFRVSPSGHLAAEPATLRTAQFEQLVGACIQYASSLVVAIERGCSIGSDHAQNCLPTSSHLTTRVAVARLRIVRAHFNKRSTRAFSKEDRHLNISNTLIVSSNIGKVCQFARRRAPCPTETHDEDTFAPDDYGWLLSPRHLPHTRDLVLQGREARAQSKFGLRPCCQPAAWRWPQSTAGSDVVIDHQNRSDGSRRRHLRSRKMDTHEAEPTQTDVKDQHG